MTLACQSTLWCPADVPNLVFTETTGGRTLRIIWIWRTWRVLAPINSSTAGGIPLIQKIPDQHQRIVSTRCEGSSSRRRPFDAVNGRRMASKFEQSLAWLTNVENPDAVRIL